MTPRAGLPAEHELDNLPWFALAGPQREFAAFGPAGRSARMLRDVGLFAATPGFEDDDWADLRSLVGDKGSAVFFRPDVPAPPADWVDVNAAVAVQMVAGQVEPPAQGFEITDLTTSDSADMVALAAATRPGPFMERTNELGHYIGARENGELIAMAGARLSTEHWVEISAVCTSPAARGRGLAAALTAAMVTHIRAEGREAVLHVADSNTTAIRVYERLGFFVRRLSGFRAVRPVL